MLYAYRSSKHHAMIWSAGVVELWTFASRFQETLGIHTVPSIAEMEQAFANPDQPKNATTAVLVGHSLPHEDFQDWEVPSHVFEDKLSSSSCMIKENVRQMIVSEMGCLSMRRC